MDKTLKNIILSSVKISASFSKARATLEDFMIAATQESEWLKSFLDYVGIVPSDMEQNFRDLNKLGTIDGKTTPKNNEFSAENSPSEKDIENLL